MTKILVVTGGSRGIGKAIITRFIAEGWQTINLSRTNCDIDGVTNLNANLSDPNWSTRQGTALKELTRHATELCLVHNTSTFNRDNITSLTEESMRESFECNIISPLTLNKLLIPHMPSGSSIIYVGSTLSEIAVADRASYVISKHALVGMMRSTCQDLQGKGITTCCVCPGFVNTRMITDQIEKQILDEMVNAKVTAGRLIETTEIADLVFFSATNPVMNGSVLHANLGQITD